jgi:ribose transport system substrate-binding protein
MKSSPRRRIVRGVPDDGPQPGARRDRGVRRVRRAASASIVVLAAALTVSAYASAGSAQHRGTPTATAAKKSLLIGWASPVESNPETATVTIGLDKAAQQLGWNVKTLDANLSPTTQVSDVQTFINLKAGGVVAWTLDPGTANNVYKAAKSAGIPLVGIASPSPEFATTIYPEIFLGCSVEQNAAKYIASRIPHAKVLVVAGPPVPSLQQEVTCFTKAAGAAGLTVEATAANTGDSASTAQPLVTTALTAHPDLQVIWAYNDPSALGAGASVISHGLKVWTGTHHGIIIIGAGGEPEAIAGIKDGQMTVTYDQNGPAIGDAAIEAIAVTLGDHHATLPKSILIPATRYDPSNVDSWVPDANRKVSLSYKFTPAPNA